MIFEIVNGKLLPQHEAVLRCNDLAIQRGYAAFDFFRTVNNRPLFLQHYLDRFFASANEMDIQVPYSMEELKIQIGQLLQQNDIPCSGIRLIATGGYSPDSYHPVSANLIIQQQPLSMPAKEQFFKGVKVMTYEYRRELPSVKSTNYLMGVWLQKHLKEKGYNDVLYFKDQMVSEFPRANVFMVTRDGVLVTPATNILFGITRKKLLEIATSILPTEQRPISLEELRTAEEVFMTSTTKRILPVTAIDGKQIGTGVAGKFSGLLNEAFIAIEKEG